MDGDEKMFNVKASIRIQLVTSGLEEFIHPDDVQDFMEEVLWLDTVKLDDEEIDNYSREK